MSALCINPLSIPQTIPNSPKVLQDIQRTAPSVHNNAAYRRSAPKRALLVPPRERALFRRGEDLEDIRADSPSTPVPALRQEDSTQRPHS